jgi:3-methylcrotonyl-CoA carboxylase alpha subunit
MKVVSIGSQQWEVDLHRENVEVVEVRAEEMVVRVDGRVHVIPYVIQDSTVSFAFEGEVYVADVTDKGARIKARHRDHSTSAPMPGVVLKILVKPGDVVTKGTPLLILEAMKMEHAIVAHTDGTITAINCQEGELVQPGVDLVTL